MIRQAAGRALRRFLLALARRAAPDKALGRAHGAALRAARHAAGVSAAYQQLLAEHGVSRARLAKHFALAELPVLTKANTFGRFALHELSRPIRPEALADVLTSSGRSRSHFGYRLTSRREHDAASFGIDLGLQDAFNVDGLPTLLVNCLPMGVVFRSRAVTVANVSVREDMACAILRDIGPRFKQTLVCTDPLFVRRLLDHGREAGVDWRALNTSVILGEEMLVEAQRDYIAAHMAIDIDRDPQRTVASSFGVGELGLNLLFESRETIRIRRAARRLPELAALIEGGDRTGTLPSVFCYAPQRVFIEVLAPDPAGWGELCITLLDTRSVMPLPRFATGDIARLMGAGEVVRAAGMAAAAAPWLPVVLIRGRSSDHAAGRPSVEALKELLYADHADADGLTGAFLFEDGEPGASTVLVQAKTAAIAAEVGLQERLNLRAAAMNPAAVFKVLAPENFPGRPMLDFERKFPYSRGADGPAKVESKPRTR